MLSKSDAKPPAHTSDVLTEARHIGNRGLSPYSSQTSSCLLPGDPASYNGLGFFFPTMATQRPLYEQGLRGIEGEGGTAHPSNT